MIDLPAIFSSINVKFKYNFITPTGVYDLTTPICPKIFNYNIFVAECDVDQYLADVAM